VRGVSEDVELMEDRGFSHHTGAFTWVVDAPNPDTGRLMAAAYWDSVNGNGRLAYFERNLLHYV
jgi:hypothetical protein